MLMSHVWKFARRSNVLRALKIFREHVLREILGFVVSPDELVRNIEDPAPVLAHDGIPGGLLAAQASLDQLVRSRRLCGGWIRLHASRIVRRQEQAHHNRAFFEVSTNAREVVGLRRYGSFTTTMQPKAGRRGSLRRVSRATEDVSETGFHESVHGLACDTVPLSKVAEAEGTPVYVYSAAVVRERFTAFDRAFAPHPHTVHYALKANSTLGLLRVLRGLSASADANSGGEIEVALRAGFTPPQIVFTGVGKRPDELARAVALGVRAINAESAGELERLDAIARAQGRTVAVALRVNPDIEATTHPHIATGSRRNKFGVAFADAAAVCREAAARAGLRFVGVHVHVGSQIVQLGPLQRARGGGRRVGACASGGRSADRVRRPGRWRGHFLRRDRGARPRGVRGQRSSVRLPGQGCRCYSNPAASSSAQRASCWHVSSI